MLELCRAWKRTCDDSFVTTADWLSILHPALAVVLIYPLMGMGVRLSDDPLSPAFWQSHDWAGVAVTGLMLFSLAARPEILRDLRLRRLHVTASVLAAVLFFMQGVTGTRDLLEIPLSWQKTALYGCDFVLRSCP